MPTVESAAETIATHGPEIRTPRCQRCQADYHSQHYLTCSTTHTPHARTPHVLHYEYSTSIITHTPHSLASILPQHCVPPIVPHLHTAYHILYCTVSPISAQYVHILYTTLNTTYPPASVYSAQGDAVCTLYLCAHILYTTCRYIPHCTPINCLCGSAACHLHSHIPSCDCTLMYSLLPLL